jgi:hypothetical protein
MHFDDIWRFDRWLEKEQRTNHVDFVKIRGTRRTHYFYKNNYTRKCKCCFKYEIKPCLLYFVSVLVCFIQMYLLFNRDVFWVPSEWWTRKKVKPYQATRSICSFGSACVPSFNYNNRVRRISNLPCRVRQIAPFTPCRLS